MPSCLSSLVSSSLYREDQHADDKPKHICTHFLLGFLASVPSAGGAEAAGVGVVVGGGVDMVLQGGRSAMQRRVLANFQDIHFNFCSHVLTIFLIFSEYINFI